ncbi:MAG: class I tRNA ligase family protein [Parcubacteria group bacterium]|nr:class I tRNA ligase family protein [Parcubacteria group bacterium]
MQQPDIEKKILEFWRKDGTFRKSVERKAPKGDYVFYDGPPFATGTPHYGHIVASLMKDMVPRYVTMQGYRVPRRWGWDCHGLPIENIVEQSHGFKHKKDILEYGVDKFNEDARSKVLTYVREWREVINRLGRWVDFDNDYKTMDLEFMESVWWVFKELHDKGLLYEAYRSMHICPRCETTLAQSEVAQGYQEVTDVSVTAKFELVDEPGTFLLAWTTTPWTLPGNMALAIGTDIEYIKVEHEGSRYVLAKERLADVFGEKEHGKPASIAIASLLGKAYKPLFPYYDNSSLENRENAFKVYAADFVNTEEGTGIVHIAPAFGEDDYELSKKENLPFVQHVAMDGTFVSEVTDFAGGFVKHQDKPNTPDHPESESAESTDVKIIKYLAAHGSLFGKEKYKHDYPHCWRCDSPLLNYATSSWFVAVEKIKSKLLKNAEKIHWSPGHIKEGRFGQWLAGARDWSISRQRFWGSVLPVWKSEDNQEIKVIGSIDELYHAGAPGITKIIFIRHAESEKNIAGIHSSALDKHPLTKAGERAARALAAQLKGERIDAIISSPILRARQTAESLAGKLGLEAEFDDRLKEDNNGTWEERPSDDLAEDASYQTYASLPLDERFGFRMGGAESGRGVCERVRAFFADAAKTHKGGTVVVVSHGIISAACDYLLRQGSLGKFYYLCDATPFASPIPFYLNADGSGFDLHKHHMDRITLKGKDGAVLRRVPDVLDCWFEAGSMPYGQEHYPFENGQKFKDNFPAEFIAEGVDQTRAWFYYLHVLAGALKGKPAFKNVAVNGIVLAEDGKKMSKRLKNYPDPMALFEKYGADAVRYYLATSPVFSAEDFNFSEKGVDEVVKKVLLIWYNVLSFYRMHADDSIKPKPGTTHLLDQWIVAKTNQLITNVTDAYDAYDLNKAARPIAGYLNDLSTWYVRRSRERIKALDTEALGTLKWALEQLSLVASPVVPFASEHVWQELGYCESIHLQAWPKAGAVDEKVLSAMDRVRQIAEQGLAARAAAGIKIRQPLSSARVTGEALPNDATELIADELNVKNITYIAGDALAVALDTEITSELAALGRLRELVRAINSMRKEKGLTPGDAITLAYHTESKELLNVFEQYGDELKKSVIARELANKKNSGKAVEINGETVNIKF